MFAVIRDEMYFLPAFLAHHRRLGVRQFLILDEGSRDGSAEFIAAQEDCVLLGSPLRYSQVVRTFDPTGRRIKRRACDLFKLFIPELWLKDRFVLGLDADEFLLLPPGLSDVNALLAVLERHRIHTVAASLLEFYPPQLSDLEQQSSVADLEDLLRQAPCYDCAPLLRFRWWGRLASCRPSASTRIFKKAGIPNPYKTTPFKVPLYHHHCNFMIDSHRTRRQADRRVVLTLAHFKFTADLYRRTEMAISLGSHSQGSRKYHCYGELFERARLGNLSILDSTTRRFNGTQALLDAGLMRWLPIH